MKISKYITAFILLAVATILLNIFSIDGFPHSLPYSYKLFVTDSEELRFTEIDACAKKYDVVFTAITTKNVGMKKEEVTFYTALNNKEALVKYLGLESGTLRDVLGNENVVYYDNLVSLDSAEELMRSVEYCYLIGDTEDCDALVNELHSKYGGAFKATKPDAGFDEVVAYGLFVFVFIILLLYCYLDASFEKKEIAIRVLHGDSALYHYVRYCLTDTLVFAAIFAACCVSIDAFSQTLRFYTNTRWIFAVFVSGVWLVNLHLLHIKPKEMLYGHQLSKKLLSMLTILGNAAALLSCLIILSMLSMVPSVQKYRKAEAFFLDKQDYAFLECSMSYEGDYENERELQNANSSEERRLYRETDSSLGQICIDDISGELLCIEREDLAINMVYCNHRALPYIESVYSEAGQTDFENYDAMILIPASFNTEETDIAKMLLLDYFEGSEGYMPDNSRIQICSYESDEEMLCFSGLEKCQFKFMTNPAIIIASDTFLRADADELNIIHSHSSSGIIFHISDDEVLQDIAEDYSLAISSTNVYEKFAIEYQLQKSLIVMIVVVTLLILLLYISVLKTILSLDYQVNATELAIKKTLGYSVFEKNRKYFISAIVIGVINLIVSTVYMMKTDMEHPWIAIVVPIVLVLLNIGLIYLMILKIEAQKLMKILKGGAL